MTAILLPEGKQSFVTSAGVPLMGGKLFTWDTGTSNPRLTWADAAQIAPNANPIILDGRGEATIFWSGVYRVQLQDSTGAIIWTVDGASTQTTAASLIPTQNNTFDLGSPAFTWRNLYLGPSGLPAVDTAGNVGLWIRSAAEIAAGVVPVDSTYPEGHVFRYGALHNGVADDTAAYQAAWKLLNPYAPGGQTIITGAIPIIANQQGRLDGTVINITGTVLEVFTATAVNDWSLRGRFKVAGDNTSTGSTVGTAAALRITDCMRFFVDAPVCVQIKGWGIRVRPGGSTSSRGEKGTIVGLQAHGCYIGLECEAGTGAEYINVLGPVITRCNTGVQVAAGNLNVTGGSIVDNTTGVHLVNGSNHGHGIFSGVQINHNATQIEASTVTNGQTFTGCHFFQGIIHFDHSTGVVLRDGIVDVDTYRFEESDGCGFINNTVPMSYGNAISNDYNGSHSYTVWQGHRTLKGEPWNGALGNVKGVRVSASMAATQVFSAANINATSIIKLDTFANASANQATQTAAAYQGYVVATGIFTVVKGGDGKARVSAQFIDSHNAADAGKYQCFLTHSFLGDFYMDAITVSTTQTIWRYEGELAIDLAQTLKFQITGAGVANNVSITNSGGTKAYVEGL